MIKKITLFLAIIATMATAQKSEMYILGNTKLLDNEIIGRRDANGQYCGAIKIISGLKGLAYQSNNGIVGNIERKPGVDIVYLSTNERVLEIFHADHKPLQVILSEQGINLKARQMWQLEISGKQKIINIPVNIITQPTGATIYLDGTQLGTGTTFQMTKGTHFLKIIKEGYRNIEKSIEVSETSTLFDETLVEIDPVMITIKSNPPEARIYMDDVEEGQTNKQLFRFPGKYKLNLRKNKYESIEQMITVREEGNNEFSYKLQKSTAILTINSMPSDATIYINGSMKNNNKIEVAQGRYRIEVKKSGYKTKSRTIIIEKGKDQTQSFTLEQITGKLQFVVEPMEANILLTQNNQQIASWNGSKYISNLPIGTYSIEISASGYSGQTKSVAITEDKLTKMDVRMEKNATMAIRSESSQSFERINTSNFNGICRDIDGNVYRTVRIGDQIWMAENLKVTKYRNGDKIPQVTKANIWQNTRSGAMCAYDNKKKNAKKYGYLYNWYAVNDWRGIAPAGWHVPTEEEWSTLKGYLGNDAGRKLKSKSGWNNNGNGNDMFGFNGLPAGYLSIYGNSLYLGYCSYFWSIQDNITAQYRYLEYYTTKFNQNNSWNENSKRYGYSIRCVKD